MRTAFVVCSVVVAAGVAAMAVAPPAPGQDLVKVKYGRLAFPSLSTLMVDVVKDQGLDRKHGLDVQPVTLGAISAYYAAVATGEVDLLPAGPHVLQKMRLEGVPITAALTFARLSALTVITGDPAIRTITDLKGRTIAADMGSSEYQILALYGRSQGVVFGKGGWTGSAWAGSSAPIPTSSRAACASAWPSPGPSSSTPRCCSPTRPSAISTR
jgi:NitT/TauT family transport system substrate-binding protein